MKKIETAKGIAYYMELPYTITLKRDDEGDMLAQIKELPGCMAHGKDANEATELLKEFQQAWIERCLESGQSVPEPEDEDALPSGKWLQRVPRGLHQKLSVMAKKENVSLNQLVATLLAEAVASKRSARDLQDLMKGLFGARVMGVSHANWAGPDQWMPSAMEGAWVCYTKGHPGHIVHSLPRLHRLVERLSPAQSVFVDASVLENAYKHKAAHSEK